MVHPNPLKQAWSDSKLTQNRNYQTDLWVKRSIKLGSDLNIILETKTIDKDQLKIELLKLDD